MPRTLILITDQFPFGKGEAPFIIPELPFLIKEFQVMIVSKTNDPRQTTELPQTVKAFRCPSLRADGWSGKTFYYLFQSLCNSMFWRECASIIRQRHRIFGRILNAFKYNAYAIKLAQQIEALTLSDKQNEIYLYSYWYSEGALALAKLKKSHPLYKTVTRTHRYDLFDEAHGLGRQPYKEQMDDLLNRVVFIAEQGKNYYLQRYHKADSSKYPVCRLGCPSHAELNPNTEHGTFCLYSCSNVIPVKRVHLIVQALALLKDKLPINWVHFGDGECMDEVKSLAEKELSDGSITYEWKGHQPSPVIFDFLKEHPVDCMITTTESEGLPVSIQEAFSYGIPLIGTAVGGIPEMINGTGILLSADPQPEEIADAIVRMHAMPEQERLCMRKNCRREWETKYCAEENAVRFVQELLSV